MTAYKRYKVSVILIGESYIRRLIFQKRAACTQLEFIDNLEQVKSECKKLVSPADSTGLFPECQSQFRNV